jgi:ABC-type xylose transport system permease subunit
MEWMGMSPFEAVGKVILLLGGTLVVLGMVLLLLSRVTVAGRLPGDFHFQWGGLSCYFPLMTGVVVSIIATLLLNLVIWLLRK